MAKIKEFESRALDLINFYRLNPVIAAEDLLMVNLPASQRVMLRDMWFKPYVMVAAGRGSGKCVTGDTIVFTDKGMKTIESMGHELSVLENISTKVKTHDGYAETLKWYYDGVKKVNSITTEYGYHISGTDEHRVLVLSEEGNLGWKYLSDVYGGDLIAIDRNINLWPETDNVSEVELNYYAYKTDTFIPKFVLEATKETVSRYLRVLFEQSGGFSNNTVIFSTRSKLLKSQLQTVLLNFGIISKVKETEICCKEGVCPIYTLYISKYFLHLFKDNIGFISQAKNRYLDLVIKENKAVYTDSDYFFDSVSSKTIKVDKVYDLVVPNKESFVANGIVNHNTFLLSVVSCLYAMLFPGKKVVITAPSFRQGRLVFDEINQRYIKSPIVREAAVKKPTFGADTCYLNFRGIENSPGSTIISVPLGTGEKIRGLRGHLIVTDEFAQVPEEIFDMVIRPMGATTTNPMEKVKRIKDLKDKLKAGIINEEDFEFEMSGESSNKIICTSSAYYTFNHMYRRMQSYEEEIKKGSKKYAVHYVSYRDMPEGFLDLDNIENARLTMSKSQFEIEYEAKWQSDSDGTFKASLIEEAKDKRCRVKLRGEQGKKYIIGVDPARSSDAFAVVVIEKSNPSSVVAAFQATGRKFPEMAKIVRDYCDKYDTELIVMDAGAGGGGVAIKDLLANEQMFGSNLILDMEDEEYKNVSGRKILRMDVPRSNTIAETNYATVNLLEQGLLKFPYPPVEASSPNIFEEKDTVYSNIQDMLKQTMSITTTVTKTGKPHFDIPADGSGSRKKDLYSAFILAAKGLYDSITMREDNSNIVNKGGLVIPVADRSGQSTYTPSITHVMDFPYRR